MRASLETGCLVTLAVAPGVLAELLSEAAEVVLEALCAWVLAVPVLAEEADTLDVLVEPLGVVLATVVVVVSAADWVEAEPPQPAIAPTPAITARLVRVRLGDIDRTDYPRPPDRTPDAPSDPQSTFSAGSSTAPSCTSPASLRTSRGSINPAPRRPVDSAPQATPKRRHSSGEEPL